LAKTGGKSSADPTSGSSSTHNQVNVEPTRKEQLHEKKKKNQDKINSK